MNGSEVQASVTIRADAEGRPMRPRLLSYCQHVLGMGHLIRSMEIVRGLTDFDTFFLNGGEMVAGFHPPATTEMINLPPIKADAEFRDITAGDGTQNLEEIMQTRKESLLAAYRRIRPQIVMIEMFPFGRKKFSFELLPLLDEIRRSGAKTKVVCSLRDILVRRNDQARWEEKVCRLVNEYFDLILIHSDPRFQRLEETFGRVPDLRCPVVYTGFVVQEQRRTGAHSDERLDLPNDGKPLIMASIGGGRVGCELLECTIHACALIENATPHHLLLVTGPYIGAQEYSRLQALAAGRSSITLLRYTDRFLLYMEKADLSISMAGYNTCMNILTARVSALVSPFTGGGDSEQTSRARKLEKLGAVTIIGPQELRPDALARKIAEGLERKAPHFPSLLDTCGVRNTQSLLLALARGQMPLKLSEVKS